MAPESNAGRASISDEQIQKDVIAAQLALAEARKAAFMKWARVAGSIAAQIALAAGTAFVTVKLTTPSDTHAGGEGTTL